MFLGGIALNRHVRVAERPQQTVSLSRLLNNPTFSIYALDNARAKTVDLELRETLVRLKEGLLVNRDKIPVWEKMLAKMPDWRTCNPPTTSKK